MYSAQPALRNDATAGGMDRGTDSSDMDIISTPHSFSQLCYRWLQVRTVTTTLMCVAEKG